MNAAAKTITFIVATIVLVSLWFMTVPGLKEPALYSDQGEVFFAQFDDPTVPTTLEVVEFNSETAELKPFRVEFRDGRWSIPSHHGYPADAKDRMAESAGMLVGLKKESVRSDDPTQHAGFGVLDPNEAGLEKTGYGKLVKFEDSAGNQLASLIIGNELEGKPDLRYVRVPGKKRVYTAKLPTIPSTDFSEWIETDLLDASGYDIAKLVFDNYSIDEQAGTRVPGDLVVAEKKDYKWTIEGLGPDEEIDTTAFSDVTNTLGDLKIVGVRQKPAGLTRNLTKAEGIELTRETAYSLQSRGFYITRDGLYANEGDLIATSDKGVQYVLRFGEILYGSGGDVTHGADDEGALKEGGDETEEKKGLNAHRFIMVTASFDGSVLAKPDGEVLAEDELSKRAAARSEIETIIAAVEGYKSKHEQALPGSLDELTQAADGETALLAELAKDPWGNDFVFAPAGDAGFAVKSLGADGQEGGDGVNHDVSSEDWKHEDDLVRLKDDLAAYDKKVEEGQAAATKLSERFAPWYYVIEQTSFEKLHKGRTELVKAKKPTDDDADAALDHTFTDDEEEDDEDEGEGEGE